MRLLFALALSLAPLSVPVAVAQEPARPSIEQLAQRITELRKQQADLKKQEDAAALELKAELKRLHDLLDALNLPDVRPPKPPEPKPPEPADALKTKLKAAFDADPAQLDARRGHAKDLAALYRQAAKLCADESVTTSGDLLARVKAAASSLVGADALRECRKVVGTELGALLPTDDALTEAQRKTVAALFGKLAAILDTF